jgi:hypothetical protein
MSVHYTTLKHFLLLLKFVTTTNMISIFIVVNILSTYTVVRHVSFRTSFLTTSQIHANVKLLKPILGDENYFRAEITACFPIA